jgi:hypothetical protein
MKEDQQRFLSLMGQMPARLTAEQTAWVLNCQSHDIPGLVAARLIRPLGNPPPNGFKFFATTEILELAKDKGWLTKMSNAIYNHWRSKNATKKNRFPVATENGLRPLPVASDDEKN